MKSTIQTTTNRLLDALPSRDQAVLRPSLKEVALHQGAILHPPGSVIKHVYFPLSGMVSLLAVMKSGAQIETAIVGRDGVVGATIGQHGLFAFGQSTVQIEGSALKISSETFLKVFNARKAFRTAVNGFQSIVLMQSQQSAACHALHTVEQRLSRWLLQSRDAIGSDRIPLTQEFLSHMLGVQRSAVSIAATVLQDAGLVKYARGKIEILNGKALSKRSCECYGAVHAYLEGPASRN